MVFYKTEAEIALMRESCLLVGKVIAEVAKFLRPGVTTMQANNIADQFIRDNKAVPNFLNYRGYKYLRLDGTTKVFNLTFNDITLESLIIKYFFLNLRLRIAQLS